MTTDSRFYRNQNGEYWYKQYSKCNREKEKLKKENERLKLVISKLDEDNTYYISENRRLKEKYDYDIEDYRQSNAELKEENEQLRKIGRMYQGENPCANCTYCVEDKVCCGIYPPILCDEMKQNYFIYGLCKKHKQIQKSIRRYGD